MKHYLPDLRCFEGRFHEAPDPSDIGLGHHPFNGISDQRSETVAVFYIQLSGTPAWTQFPKKS